MQNVSRKSGRIFFRNFMELTCELLTLLLLVAIFTKPNDAKKLKEMTKTLACGYSSESTYSVRVIR